MKARTSNGMMWEAEVTDVDRKPVLRHCVWHGSPDRLTAARGERTLCWHGNTHTTTTRKAF